jgi:hypothetical protein
MTPTMTETADRRTKPQIRTVDNLGLMAQAVDNSENCLTGSCIAAPGKYSRPPGSAGPG